MIVRITSKYGAIDSVHRTPHTGIDLAMPEGTPLRSISEGVVKRILDYGDKNVGKGVIIQHQDGTQSIYGHLSQIQVKQGDILQKGEQFALSGNTGHSTGPHLHFGLKSENGALMDPTPLADQVAKNAGDMGLIDRIIANGRVGDGIGDIPEFSVWRWLGGKVSEITRDGAADFIADFTLAFPIIAVVGCGVYALINMVSKNAAKYGALATLLYGLYLTI